jgi:hypothetical protein
LTRPPPLNKSSAVKSFLPLVLFLAGCAHTPDPQAKIKIESDPTGARIYHGAGSNTNRARPSDYLGTTPFTWTLQLNEAGEVPLPRIKLVNKFGPQPWMIIEARPPADCLTCVTQQFIYRGRALFRDQDKIPEALFFDLRR